MPPRSSAWVERSDWVEHLAADPATRSNTSVCLKFADGAVAGLDEDGRRALAKKIDALLEAEDAAYDIDAYRDAPPGLRIWCGATVDTADIEALGPWLDWAFRHRHRKASNGRTETDMPKVLISDQMDPKAAEIFRAQRRRGRREARPRQGRAEGDHRRL